MRQKILALLCCMALLFTMTPTESNALGQQYITDYTTPGYYTYTLPVSGVWEFECWGGRGGDDSGSGGPGSYISGMFQLEAGTTIKICVGNAGASGTALGQTSYGGGGGTGGLGWSGQGGGASYVVTGNSYTLSTYGYDNDDILIVAGGGGGGTSHCDGNPADSGSTGPMGYGASHPSGGDSDGGGGGGGYQGGWNAPDFHRTQGGSSYVNDNRGFKGTHTRGSNYGAGRVRISVHGYYIKFRPNPPSNTESVPKGSMPDQFMMYNVPDYLDKNKFTLKGYVWLGWTLNPNGTGTWYEDEQLVVD